MADTLTTPSAPRPTLLRAWLMATRPATLSAAITPVLVGTAAGVHSGNFRLLPFLAALACSILIQIGTNVANDYFDFRKGADTAERLGPIRVTQAGLIPPTTVRNGMILIFATAALIGLYLVFAGGAPILLIGIFSIAAGVLYTGGPFPLAYHSLGDVFVFVFFGPVAVLGSEYLQSGAITPTGVVASIPVAMLVTAILVVNNLRDIATDRKTNKFTLAVRIGARATRIEYFVLVTLAYLTPLCGWLAGVFSVWGLASWLTLPLAIQLARIVLTQEGRPLNRALAGTGRLHLLFGVLLSFGLML